MLDVLPAMQSERGQLTPLSGILSSNKNILHEALRKADAVIEGSSSHPPPDIDELLVAPTVISNQLYNLVAEEKALVTQSLCWVGLLNVVAYNLPCSPR